MCIERAYDPSIRVEEYFSKNRPSPIHVKSDDDGAVRCVSGTERRVYTVHKAKDGVR